MAMNNSLAEVHPELVSEWSEKNLLLTPDGITFGSNKKVWWKGTCGHECPMSRYDDMLLILHYYNRYGYIPAGNLPLEDIVFNYRAYGLPCFETIRRARQRVQSLFPEYSRNPQKEEQSGSISIVININ